MTSVFYIFSSIFSVSVTCYLLIKYIQDKFLLIKKYETGGVFDKKTFVDLLIDGFGCISFSLVMTIALFQHIKFSVIQKILFYIAIFVIFDLFLFCYDFDKKLDESESKKLE